MDPLEIFNASQLRPAIDSTKEKVKSCPSDIAERMTLADLLLFIDDYESADRHLEAIAIQAPDLQLATGIGRQIVRGAEARMKTFQGAAIPSFLDPVDDVATSQLRLLTHYRESDFDAVTDIRHR